MDPLRFEWACARDDGRPCFSADSRGVINGSTWLVPGSLLEAEVNHTFTVTISKGAHPGGARTLGRGAVPVRQVRAARTA